MKDAKHHMKHVLKKVIRKARQNPEIKEHLNNTVGEQNEETYEEERELEPVETYRWYGLRRLPQGRRGSPRFR